MSCMACDAVAQAPPGVAATDIWLHGFLSGFFKGILMARENHGQKGPTQLDFGLCLPHSVLAASFITSLRDIHGVSDRLLHLDMHARPGPTS